MTSIWPLRLRPLLTLIFLTGLVRSPLTDATVPCRTGRFKRGEIITARPESSQKLYCGVRVGQFLAVEENILFHLDCPKGSPPGQATAVIIDMTEPRIVKRYFDDQQGCDVKAPQGMTTGANAYAVAGLFKGGRVPYHNNCNAQHYFDYLLYGRVNNQYSLHTSCPVYGEFNAHSSINKNAFRFKDKFTEYTWSNSLAR
ncbi:unnamed protein product [Bemisia tabaci]|uniref:Uncharacterized protein n=1 Tax=Bemisia tabaci TaxID=7038 RepID=A0A9P0AGH9_BEMTA|nr:unnamed protein product [Bemisia tabaci]